MTQKIKIDWAWLKQTPPGTWGQLPGLGLTWYHPHQTPMKGETLTIDLGETALRRQANSNQRPYEVSWCHEDRAEIMTRCPNRLAATH